MKKFLSFLIAGALGLIIASCGDDDRSNMTIGATAQTNKQVVASLQKPTALEWMWAFLSGDEANATHETFCTNKQFSLSVSEGGHVCIEKAYVVFDEIELEQDNDLSEADDEVEFGPFVLDLFGSPGDGIPGEINITVPSGQAFDEVKFKVDDLDDDNEDGDINDSNDDPPVNVTIASAAAAGLTDMSFVLTGSATNGSITKSFIFKTDIEAKIKIPLDPGNPLIFSGDNIIAHLDFSAGFANLAFSEIPGNPPTPSTMQAIFNPSGSSSIKCDANGDNIIDPSLSAAHKLACRIIKDIDLFEDDNNDDVAGVAELRGDDDDPGEVDDSGSPD